ncbi:unnamed protein product, partial [Rotaria sp. Silwood2]
MSEICEHPFCTRLISATCSNHCQLDLCQEHITEHKDLFVAQYEKYFSKVTESLNELINSIEENKKYLNNNYRKDTFLINENYENKINKLEQEFQLLILTQKLIKQKLQVLNDVKNGQAFLYQYDIEQIKLYLKQIHEYHQDKMTTENNKNNIEQSFSFNFTNTTYNTIRHFYGQCPLTRLGIYGITAEHKLRLCSSKRNKSDICLLKHFNHYHHLTWTL